jgi:hypothetical protein
MPPIAYYAIEMIVMIWPVVPAVTALPYRISENLQNGALRAGREGIQKSLRAGKVRVRFGTIVCFKAQCDLRISGNRQMRARH